MKVLVVCVPQAGHVKPLLPLVSSLVRAGDEVVVATAETVAADVRATGASFEPAGKGIDTWFGRLAGRTRGQPGDGLPPERIEHYFVPRLFCEIGAADMVDEALAVGTRLQPDVVVFDPYAFAGPLVARVLGAHGVNHLIGALAAPEVTQLATDAMSPLWREQGLDAPLDAGVYDGTTLAICPPSMDRAEPPRGTRRFLRPAPLPVRPAARQSPPLVYFTLGTIWANAAIVRTVLDALGELPVRVVATLGALDPSELSDAAPPNVELHSFLPQQDLLPDAALVIHHAGAGTTFGALAHGLPQVALPQAADNFTNASMLADSGAAVTLLPDQLNRESVAEAVLRTLTDPSYARAAGTLAAEIAAMPTADEAAAALALTVASDRGALDRLHRGEDVNGRDSVVQSERRRTGDLGPERHS